MRDGIYQVTRYQICAGFIVRGGRIVACAPILRKRLGWWASQGVWIGPESRCQRALI